MKSEEFLKLIRENASAGATAAGGVATVTTGLGGGTKTLIKRQKNYTNQRTPGGAVKAKK